MLNKKLVLTRTTDNPTRSSVLESFMLLSPASSPATTVAWNRNSNINSNININMNGDYSPLLPFNLRHADQSNNNNTCEDPQLELLHCELQRVKRLQQEILQGVRQCNTLQG
jgi:hypothetical protein